MYFTVQNSRSLKEAFDSFFKGTVISRVTSAHGVIWPVTNSIGFVDLEARQVLLQALTEIAWVQYQVGRSEFI